MFNFLPLFWPNTRADISSSSTGAPKDEFGTQSTQLNASRLLLLTMMLLLPMVSFATTYPVTTTADSDTGSLWGNFAGLAPGNYTVTIADSADPSCNATDNVRITTAADGENPVLDCQDISVAIGASGSYMLTAAEILLGPTDDNLFYSISEPVFSCDAIGTPQSVELTATDTNTGDTEQCTVTVTVTDGAAPTITCADDISTDNDNGDCSAYVTVPFPVITDNCFSSNAPMGTQADPFTSLAQAGSVFGAGTFFFDVDGNQFSTFVECGWIMIASSPSTATTDLTITSTVTPQSNSILPPAVYADLTIGRLRLNATGGPNLPFDVETDNPAVLANLASNVVLHTGVVGGANEWTGDGANRMVVPCNGGQTSNFTLDRGIFQACGNASGLHWAPTIAAGGSQAWVSVDYQSGTNDLNLWAQAAAPVISLTNDITGTCDASGTYPVGTTTITWTATDAAGNMAQCTQDVTVIDAEAPAITCPAGVTVVAPSAAGAVATYADPVGTDNCPSASTALTAGLASGSTFPIGTTPVEFTVTDAANLMTNCTFNVTVNGTAPMIECPANIVVNADADDCETTVDFTATESTGIPASTISYSIAPGSVFSVGPAVDVTATATNAAGTDACTIMVTVTGTCSAILPVEYLSLSATGKKDHILLEWTTENEEEHLGFYIERRAETESEFQEMDFVAATTTTASNYTFNDHQVLPANNYTYRLRQTNFDGTTAYSPLILARTQDAKEGLTAWPNPTNGALFVQATSSITQATLHDATSRTVRTFSLVEGFGKADLSDLSKGVYFLRVGDLVRRVVR
jgi:hypothetical protein